MVDLCQSECLLETLPDQSARHLQTGKFGVQRNPGHCLQDKSVKHFSEADTVRFSSIPVSPNQTNNPSQPAASGTFTIDLCKPDSMRYPLTQCIAPLTSSNPSSTCNVEAKVSVSKSVHTRTSFQSKSRLRGTRREYPETEEPLHANDHTGPSFISSTSTSACHWDTGPQVENRDLVGKVGDCSTNSHFAGCAATDNNTPGSSCKPGARHIACLISTCPFAYLRQSTPETSW